MCAARLRRASAHWSWVDLVMAPAHRDEEATLRSRLRAAQVSLSWSRPPRHRTARSRPASEPRWAPTRANTFASAVHTRSRSRIATPDGPGTTNASAMGRQGFFSAIAGRRFQRLLCPVTGRTPPVQPDTERGEHLPHVADQILVDLASVQNHQAPARSGQGRLDQLSV